MLLFTVECVNREPGRSRGGAREEPGKSQGGAREEPGGSGKGVGGGGESRMLGSKRIARACQCGPSALHEDARFKAVKLPFYLPRLQC